MEVNSFQISPISHEISSLWREENNQNEKNDLLKFLLNIIEKTFVSTPELENDEYCAKRIKIEDDCNIVVQKIRSLAEELFNRIKNKALDFSIEYTEQSNCLYELNNFVSRSELLENEKLKESQEAINKIFCEFFKTAYEVGIDIRSNSNNLSNLHTIICRWSYDNKKIYRKIDILKNCSPPNKKIYLESWISNLRAHPLYSDMTIEVNQTSFNVHRNILARNQVFAKLNLSTTKLKVENTSERAMALMLDYLYGIDIDDKLQILTLFGFSEVIELFNLSFLFEIKSLMNLCEWYLNESLNKEKYKSNQEYVNSLYQLACKNSLTNLLKSCQLILHTFRSCKFVTQNPSIPADSNQIQQEIFSSWLEENNQNEKNDLSKFLLNIIEKNFVKDPEYFCSGNRIKIEYDYNVVAQKIRSFAEVLFNQIKDRALRSGIEYTEESICLYELNNSVLGAEVFENEKLKESQEAINKIFCEFFKTAYEVKIDIRSNSNNLSNLHTITCRWSYDNKKIYRKIDIPKNYFPPEVKTALKLWISNLRVHPLYSDMTIEVNQTSFNVHRNILAQNKVFANLIFQMSSPSPRLKIANTSEAAMELLLNYLYGIDIDDQLKTLTSFEYSPVVELLNLSSTFKIQALVNLCEWYLNESLNEEKYELTQEYVTRIHSLARKHSLTKLCTSCCLILHRFNFCKFTSNPEDSNQKKRKITHLT